MLFETIETHKTAKDIMWIDKSGDENPGRLKILAFLRAHPQTSHSQNSHPLIAHQRTSHPQNAYPQASHPQTSVGEVSG